MLELYDHILSVEAYTIRLAMSLMDVSHERRVVDHHPAAEPPSPGVVHLNPAGTLPVLVDGPVVLTTVPDIVRHLSALYDIDRVWGSPDDPQVARWLAFALGPLSALSRARAARLFSAPGDASALRQDARAALRSVEDHLTDRTLSGEPWLAGPQPTLADIAVFPPVMLSHDCGVGHEDYPAINLWQRRVRRLPGFVGMPGIPDYF